MAFLVRFVVVVAIGMAIVDAMVYVIVSAWPAMLAGGVAAAAAGVAMLLSQGRWERQAVHRRPPRDPLSG